MTLGAALAKRCRRRRHQGKVWGSRDPPYAGEIALMSPERDVAKAEAYFERALSVARNSKRSPWNCELQ